MMNNKTFLHVFSALWQMTRAPEWWRYKIPPVLALGYVQSLELQLSASTAAWHLLHVVTAIGAVASYGFIFNDVCDIEADRLARKTNRMSACPLIIRNLLLLGYIGLGLLPTVCASGPLPTVILLCNYIIPTLYSAKPFRLKERGVLGVAADALGAHLLPTCFVFSLFPATASSGKYMFYVVAFLMWSTALGLRGILTHMLLDVGNDKVSNVKTYVTSYGKTEAEVTQTIQYMTAFIFRFELICFFLAISALSKAVTTLVIGMVVYLALEVCKRSFEGPRSGIAYVLLQFRLFPPFYDNEFYETWFPLLTLISLSVYRVEWLSIALIHLILFFAGCQQIWQHYSRAVYSCVNYVLRGWFVDGFQPCKVALRNCGPICDNILVTMNGKSEYAWQQRLIAKRLKLENNTIYNFQFKAQSASPRSIIVGVWEAKEPWEHVGLFKEIWLGRKWICVDEPLVVQFCEKEVYFGIWVGGWEDNFIISKPSIKHNQTIVREAGLMR